MKKNPIQSQDTSEYGLVFRSIFGFGIFAYNHVKLPPIDRPIVRFFQDVIQRLPCSAHVGPIGLGGGTATEIFGPSAPDNMYMSNRVGLSGRQFYSLDGEYYTNLDGCFFPRARTPFLGADAEDFYEIIGHDALALMIGSSPEADKEMSSLYKAPFPGHENWLKALTRIYDVVVLTGADADFIVACARTSEHFSLLEESTAVIKRMIISTEWYQQHEPELVWDGEFGMCYIVPE